MNKIKKRILFVTFITFLTFLSAEGTWSIDFYGVSSTDLDKNMADMTSDLYYTQLCEIKDFSVTDKRGMISDNTVPEKSELSDINLSFYTVIEKKENSSKWLATLHIVNKITNSHLTSTKEFDSYYKILMEGKKELQDSFISLIQKNEKSSSDEQDIPPLPAQNETFKASTESLAGTWTGEQNIEKILIMRGGRGFVIFKNGASMNISVKIEDSGSTVIVSQTGKSNASFFPDLPRQMALEAALNADPIKWEFKISGDNTLIGVKNTLYADGDTVQSGNIDVEWNRKL
ncbi:MAG: hypothetical protein MJ182_07300 [Treponema sp.]|nr:hypothetical protein [Treponema sp.]